MTNKSEDLIGQYTTNPVMVIEQNKFNQPKHLKTQATWCTNRAILRAIIRRRGVVSLPYNGSDELFDLGRVACGLEDEFDSQVHMDEWVARPK